MNIYVEHTSDQNEMLRKSPLYRELTKKIDRLREDVMEHFDRIEKSFKRTEPSISERIKSGKVRYRLK